MATNFLGMLYLIPSLDTQDPRKRFKAKNESKKLVKNFQWQKLYKDCLGLNIILKHQILAHPIKLLDKIHTHKLWPKLEVKLLN